MVEIHFHSRIAFGSNSKRSTQFPSISSLGSMDFTQTSRPGNRHSSGSLWSRGPLNFRIFQERKNMAWIFVDEENPCKQLTYRILVKSQKLTHDLIIPTWVYSERVRLVQCDQLPSSSLLWYRWLVQVVPRVGWDAPAGYFTGFCCWKLD